MSRLSFCPCRYPQSCINDYTPASLDKKASEVL